MSFYFVYFLSFIFILSIYRTSILDFDAIFAALDFTVTLPDFLEDVCGHNVPEGVEEELSGDKEAEAEERDTGHPETIGAPGEIGVVKEPREAGYSSSHQNSATTLVKI